MLGCCIMPSMYRSVCNKKHKVVNSVVLHENLHPGLHTNVSRHWGLFRSCRLDMMYHFIFRTPRAAVRLGRKRWLEYGVKLTTPGLQADDIPSCLSFYTVRASASSKASPPVAAVFLGMAPSKAARLSGLGWAETLRFRV